MAEQSNSNSQTPSNVSSLMPIFAAVLATVLSSLAWITQGESVRYISTLTFLGGETVLATVLTGSFLFYNKKIPSIQLLLENRIDIFKLLISRQILATAIMTYALTMTESSKAMFLTKMEPYLVMFWFWIFHKVTLTRYHLILLTIHVIGALLLSTDGNFQIGIDQFGDLLLLIGIGFSSFSYLSAQRVSKVLSATQTIFVTEILAGILFVPLALGIDGTKFFSTDPNILYSWYQTLLTVLLYFVFGVGLWYYALRGTQAWLISALRCIGPVLAAPVAWLVYNQTLSLIQIFGALVVVVTSVMMVKARDRV